MPINNFFDNTGGLNVTDGPFYVGNNQATAGWNFDYSRKGSIVKSRDRVKVNSAADTQLKSLGLGLYNTTANAKTVVRAGGTKIQTYNLTTGLATNIAADTVAAGTDFLVSGSTQPVNFTQFNTPSANILWLAGGGASSIFGYTGSKITQNGTTAPTGVLTLTNLGSATGGAFTTGTYYYALVLRKSSTQVLSNAALDASVVIATATDTVRLTFPSTDSTLYDQWYIYRSAVGGVTNFTTGTLIAQVSTASATYTDTGGVSVATSQVVPRAGNTTDNSLLPTAIHGVYSWQASAPFVTSNTIAFVINGRSYSVPFATDNATTLQNIANSMSGDTDVMTAIVGGARNILVTAKDGTALAITASLVTGGASQATISVTTLSTPLSLGSYQVVTSFKRRLVTAQNSTFYLSDLDKPESWPTANSFTIPTGGNITAVAAIGFNAPISSTIDEYLVIFKETETWVFTGNSSSDWELKFVDSVGCANQPLVVSVNNYLGWIDYRGIYMWNGVGKPIYVSRPIEGLFYPDGDLDKTKLNLGWGQYYRKQSQLIWCVSHRTKGENSFLIKLDLRLTSTQITADMSKQVVEGRFTPGYMATSTGAAAPMYAGLSYIPSDKEEVFLIGDGLGNIFRQFYAFTADGSGIDFQYETKHLDLEQPSIAKRYKKVIVWIEEVVHGQLTLQYWADYRIRNTEESQIDVDMDPKGAVASLWDLAIWDQSMWDDYQVKLKGLVFNLGSSENNAEGDSLKLRFLQQDANVPVTIHGFSVYWEELGMRK